jgi:hypothetical protein
MTKLTDAPFELLAARVSQSDLYAVDRLAVRLKVPRAEAIRQLISLGLQAHEASL